MYNIAVFIWINSFYSQKVIIFSFVLNRLLIWSQLLWFLSCRIEIEALTSKTRDLWTQLQIQKKAQRKDVSRDHQREPMDVIGTRGCMLYNEDSSQDSMTFKRQKLKGKIKELKQEVSNVSLFSRVQGLPFYIFENLGFLLYILCILT